MKGRRRLRPGWRGRRSRCSSPGPPPPPPAGPTQGPGATLARHGGAHLGEHGGVADHDEERLGAGDGHVEPPGVGEEGSGIISDVMFIRCRKKF